MKSQHAWIVLFVALPLVFALWAFKTSRDGGAFDASYAPVKVGNFFPVQANDPWPGSISVGRDFVANEHFLFDLKTGRGRAWQRGGLVSTFKPQTLTWEFVEGLKIKPHLVVRDGAQTSSYDLPDSYEFDLSLAPDSDAMVFARNDAVAMLTDRHFYRWKRNRPALVQEFSFSSSGECRAVLSRDWKTLILVEFGAISVLSTQNGRRLRHLKAARFQQSEALTSAFWGDYALYGNAVPGAASQAYRWDVFDARTGRALWKFDLEDDMATPAYATEPNRIALPFPSRGVWEIHRFPGGELMNTLPLVSGAKSGDFSPDGATLYSVAGGVLYRQRAR